MLIYNFIFQFSSNETVPEIDEQNTSKSFVSCVDTQNDSQTNISDSKMTENELFSTPTSKRQFGDVKSEILGTPVLKNFSSYGNRPTHEHFAKGMVDMVDHENLPNSIGTFQKLKEILKDVRKTIKDLIWFTFTFYLDKIILSLLKLSYNFINIYNEKLNSWTISDNILSLVLFYYKLILIYSWQI